jgi:Na+/melibiose symporter-like transporter
VATPVLSAFFYGLTGSMNRAMAWATLCMSVFLLASMDWMLRAHIRRPAVRLAAMLTFLASLFGHYTVFREDGQQLFFAMCSFYACYLICFFVVLGDYARARTSEKLRLPALGLSLFLCFCTGMQSLRQTAVMIMPLGCVEALRQLIVFRENKKLVRKEILRGSKCLGYAISNAAGFLFIKLILKPAHHNVYGNTSSRDAKDTVEGIRTSFVSLFGTMGLDPATVTKQGAVRIMLGLLAIILAAAVLYTTIRLIRTKEKDGYLYVVVLFWIGVLGVLLP